MSVELLQMKFNAVMDELNKSFPNQAFLNNQQTCKFLGTTDKTLKKYYGKYRNDKLGGYPKTTVAEIYIGVKDEIA